MKPAVPQLRQPAKRSISTPTLAASAKTSSFSTRTRTERTRSSCEADRRDLFGQRFQQLDVAAGDDGADRVGDPLVADDVGQIVVQVPVLAHGQIEVDPHPLLTDLLVPMHADLAGQHEVADEDVADGVARIGDAQRLTTAARSAASCDVSSRVERPAVIRPRLAADWRLAASRDADRRRRRSSGRSPTARQAGSGRRRRFPPGRPGAPAAGSTTAGRTAPRVCRGAGQRRAGTDGVDPDARRQRHRQRLRQRPQPRLADGVRGEVRRQVPHPLVEQVDHAAACVRRQLAGRSAWVSTKGARRLTCMCRSQTVAGRVSAARRARTPRRC